MTSFQEVKVPNETFQEVEVPNESYSKVVDKNGSVAVVLTNDYGSGWSTCSKYKAKMMFDSKIVWCVYTGFNKSLTEDEYNEWMMETIFPEIDDGYIPGCFSSFRQLTVEFIPKNTMFTISENDGAEHIVYDIFIA